MLQAYLENKKLIELKALLPIDPQNVKISLEKLLGEQPSNTRALSILARCYVLCKELPEAKATLENLISLDSGDYSAKVELAKMLIAEEDFHKAASLLQEATSMAAQIDENWLLLSKYLHDDGQKQASIDARNQYDMIKAFNNNLAAAERAFAKAEFVEADKICWQLQGQVPNELRVLRLLAKLAKQFHHFEISASILARCIETAPANEAIGIDYVYALLSSRKFQEALEQCHRLIKLAPENIDIYDVKAEVLFELGRYEDAIAIYRELSNVHEKRALSSLHLGKVLATVGETQQAIDCFHQALDSEFMPGQTQMPGQAYWELANLKTYHFPEDEIGSMQQLLNAGYITALNKVLIQFALGRALEDKKQFAKSFEHYQSANRGYSKIKPFNYISQNADFISFFTAEYFSGHKDSGILADAPVFVVGLPRSGSTLVEQILSSHSQVDSTQELAKIISIARELGNPNQPEKIQYPQSLSKLSPDQIQNLAQGYLDYAQAFRQQASYFVDKAPGNFHHIGLIKTLLPNARIIDIRRNPMGSGWSLYKHFFSDSFLFSYDLTTIGQYYNDYIELMDHWHRVLPGQILTIGYEDLVNDFPATVDSLLQYCGLPFEQACLDFHLNKRAVATPSAEQVRQPIYTESLDHWKNYEEFLNSLKDVVRNHRRSV